jgi:hypothetical protein
MKNILLSCSFIFVILFFQIFLFTTGSFSCSFNNDRDYCTNPDSVIAAEIHKGKIVMMGEMPHSSFLLYNAFINVLNNWLKSCENNRSESFTLHLVFEVDSLTAEYINDYVHRENDSLMFYLIAPYAAMEDIEFYTKLRNFNKEVDRLNEGRAGKNSINIIGFEEIGMNTKWENSLKNQAESERWFVNQRDEYTSSHLINYIRSYGNQSNEIRSHVNRVNYNHDQYLLLYGDAHLQNGYVNKNLGFTIPLEESFGYYLAYYLNKEFGEDNVTCFEQGIYNEKVFENTFLNKYSSKDVLVPSDEFPLKDTDPAPNMFRVIRHFVSPFVRYEPHPFNTVFSRYEIERLLDKIELLEKFRTGYKANLFFVKYLQKAFLITGAINENSLELRGWLNENPGFSGLERMDSPEYSAFIYGVLKEPGNNDRMKLLNELGFSGEDFTFYSNDSVTWSSNWKEINKKAKFVNCIGMYWIGYPEERSKAKEYLVQFTGEDYSAPEEYLKWYRSKYYGYSE